MKLSKRKSEVLAAEQGVIAELASIEGLAANSVEGTGADVVRTYPASKGLCHVIYGVHVSYDDAPPAGSTLVITFGGAVVYKIALTASGAGPINFPRPLRSKDDVEVVVTLLNPGAATGNLNVFHEPCPAKTSSIA